MVPSGNGCYIVISHEYFSYVYYIPLLLELFAPI
jgi:hypothetical protein